MGSSPIPGGHSRIEIDALCVLSEDDKRPSLVGWRPSQVHQCPYHPVIQTKVPRKQTTSPVGLLQGAVCPKRPPADMSDCDHMALSQVPTLRQRKHPHVVEKSKDRNLVENKGRKALPRKQDSGLSSSILSSCTHVHVRNWMKL